MHRLLISLTRKVFLGLLQDLLEIAVSLNVIRKREIQENVTKVNDWRKQSHFLHTSWSLAYSITITSFKGSTESGLKLIKNLTHSEDGLIMNL